MKYRFVVLAIALGAMMFLGSTSAPAQVRFGLGIQVNVPPPPGGFEDVVVYPSYPGAVWVRGCWTWNSYERRNVWIPGHWMTRYHSPVYRERAYTHVPHGVARGWWRKHGGEVREGYGRGGRRYRDE